MSITRLLSTLDFKFLFSYLQLWRSYAILSATTQRAFRSMVDILSTWWWSLLIWHNFVKVADNWINFRSPAYIGTHNRHVKFKLKIPKCLGKIVRKSQGACRQLSSLWNCSYRWRNAQKWTKRNVSDTTSSGMMMRATLSVTSTCDFLLFFL